MKVSYLVEPNKNSLGGHALTSLLTEGAIPLHKVTILPRGGALGFVYFY